MESRAEMEKAKQISKVIKSEILPKDIMMEILSRLPARSLLRYMCVSRDWKSLISNNSFKLLHRQNHGPNPPLMLVLHEPKHYSFTLTTFNLHGEVVQQWSLPDIFPSLSRLQMIPFPSQSKLVCFVAKEGLYLCNPTTRRIFPLIPIPRIRSKVFGFGYVQSKDEYMFVYNVKEWVKENYKILSLSISNNDDDLQYNAWKSIDVTTTNHLCFTSNLGVFVCGIFYWQAIYRSNICIVSFDPETQVFSTVDLPVKYKDYLDDFKYDFAPLMEIKGELYSTTLIPNWLNHHSLQMWKASGVKNQLWTKSYVISSQDFDRYKYYDAEILIYMQQYLEENYHHGSKSYMRKLMRKLRLKHRRGIGIHSNLFTL